LFVADSRAAKMRPVFVGNLDFDTRHSELDHLFYRYGRIERIDMKSGLLAFTLPPPPPIVCPPRSAFVFDF
jgi:arginine/serine-rich splicing factor 4/5/6